MESSWISLTWNGDCFGLDSLQPFLMVCWSVWQRLKKMNHVHSQSNWNPSMTFSTLKPPCRSIPLACAGRMTLQMGTTKVTLMGAGLRVTLVEGTLRDSTCLSQRGQRSKNRVCKRSCWVYLMKNCGYKLTLEPLG